MKLFYRKKYAVTAVGLTSVKNTVKIKIFLLYFYIYM